MLVDLIQGGSPFTDHRCQRSKGTYISRLIYLKDTINLQTIHWGGGAEVNHMLVDVYEVRGQRVEKLETMRRGEDAERWWWWGWWW